MRQFVAGAGFQRPFLHTLRLSELHTWRDNLPNNFNKYLYLIVFNILISQVYAQEAQIQPSHALSLATYFAQGDFDLAQDTDILYLPVRYEYDSQSWGFQLLVPHLQVKGPGAVLINLGGVNQAVAGNEIRRESGLGDIVGSAIYHVPVTGSAAPFVDLRLDVKFPTADETRGLGSGETDLNLQLDVSQYWNELLVFATLGYSFRGDSPLYPNLRDGAYLQLGAARQLTSSVSLGGLLDYRESAATQTDDILEAGPYMSWQLSDNWLFSAFSLVGFTGASVDFSLLGQLRYRF